VTARGTVFEVSLESDKRVTVRLLRGAVDVERPALSRERPARRPSRVLNRARPSVSRPSRRPCFDPRREGLSFSLSLRYRTSRPSVSTSARQLRWLPKPTGILRPLSV
jgi:hypothetical protein